MAVGDRLQTTWTDMRAMGRILARVHWLLPNARLSADRLLERRADEEPGHVFLRFGDARWSRREVDEAANRYAHFFRAQGIGPGDVVAVLMDNRPDYLFAITGLNKLRAVAALINHNLAGAALAHAINVASSKGLLVGTEHLERAEAVADQLETVEIGRTMWVRSDPEATDDAVPSHHRAIDSEVAAAPADRPTDVPNPVASEPMLYIYTSGTTGLPKAAIISHQRFLGAAVMFGFAIQEGTPQDTIYVTLPLYHANAQFAGWGAALASGASIALRRKFSASNFWGDIRRYDATMFIYIGELCRYLLNQPPSPDDRAHRVRLATGNGLRADVWRLFQDRFGVPLIREFYGATEGNIPLVNFAGRPGMVGRLRPGQLVVACDPATGDLLRESDGLCRPVGPGSTGLLLGRISPVMRFDGYVDRGATQKKIVSDVRRRGDRYFNSGDLVQLHEHGWVSFADRLGDTFRWKGENVSTNEVADALNEAPGVQEANVYGVTVPGAEGRAGMAALSTEDQFDLETFAAFVNERLPAFQRPHFVRLARDMRITGTFKHQKVDYRDEGYDPSRVSDPLYYLDGTHYVPLTPALYEQIQRGEIGPR